MLRLVALVGIVLSFLPLSAGAQASASCSDFDAWEWAQSVFESNPAIFDSLDEDGDGVACPQLARGGFASAWWVDSIPASAEPAEIIRIIDGDTFEVLIDGVSNRVRIYRADTPETQNEQHCGGQQATDFATWALSFNDNGNTVYLERDKNSRDQYGRELAYVWFEADGQPYLLNHILINNGWAEDVDYGDRKYDSQLQDAAAFADRHDLGVWSLCGGFGIPAASATQPDPAPADNVDEPVYEPSTDQAYQPEPPAEEPPASGGCDPNYSGCVPIVPYDLDCADIGFSVTILGNDPHGFDGNDNDGYGCESY